MQEEIQVDITLDLAFGKTSIPKHFQLNKIIL